MIKVISTFFSDFDKAKCEVLFNFELKKCILKYYNNNGRHVSTEELPTSSIPEAEKIADNWIYKYNQRKESPSALMIDLIKNINKAREKSDIKNEKMKNILFNTQY